MLGWGLGRPPYKNGSAGLLKLLGEEIEDLEPETQSLRAMRQDVAKFSQSNKKSSGSI